MTLRFHLHGKVSLVHRDVSQLMQKQESFGNLAVLPKKRHLTGCVDTVVTITVAVVAVFGVDVHVVDVDVDVAVVSFVAVLISS